jgi:hypothetical protein
MLRLLSIATLALVALAGCAPSNVSATDQADVQKEFSKDNYEKAMIAAGKEKELEEEKKKEAAHLAGGGGSDQDAGQH